MKLYRNKFQARAIARFPAVHWSAIGMALLALAALAVLLSACAAPAAPAVVAAPVVPAGAQPAVLPAEISIPQAAEKRAQGAFILDVRQPDEWNQVHIPGATLIPLGELSSRLKEVPTDREVVVVCRSGNRSQQGRDILRSAGYTQVTSMAGGVVQWQAQGLPVVSGP